MPGVKKVIFINVTPEVALKRKDDIPNMGFLIKRYEKYEYLSKKFGWSIVNGDNSIDQVSKDLLDIFRDAIEKK
jgi:thymidylate kinase